MEAVAGAAPALTVEISFYEADSFGSGPGIKRSSKSAVTVIFLSEQHSLTTVAEQLFAHHLKALLGEELYEHLWSFSRTDADADADEDEDDGDFDDLGGLNAEAPLQVLNLAAGQEFLFSYDMGSPTQYIVKVDSVGPAAEPAALYPMKKAETDAQQQKRQRIGEQVAAAGETTFDTAFPLLSRRLLRGTNIRLDLGVGSDALHSAGSNSRWLKCWGGGTRPAYTSSIECTAPFSDVDELWACLEAGIARQDDPESRHLVKVKFTKRDGSSYTAAYDLSPECPLSVNLHALPRSHVGELPGEYNEDIFWRESVAFSDPRLEPLRREATDELTQKCDRWSFNFQLPEDWRTQEARPAFSFSAAFPKCSKWITHAEGRAAHWFGFASGVLRAYKVKNACKHVASCHDTLKHDTLHAAFLDMEARLVIPKAWK